MSLIQDALKRQQQENQSGAPNAAPPPLPSDAQADAPRGPEVSVPETMPAGAAPEKSASKPWATGLLAAIFICAIIATVMYLGWFFVGRSFMTKKNAAQAPAAAVTPGPAPQPGTQAEPAPAQEAEAPKQEADEASAVQPAVPAAAPAAEPAKPVAAAPATAPDRAPAPAPAQPGSAAPAAEPAKPVAATPATAPDRAPAPAPAQPGSAAPAAEPAKPVAAAPATAPDRAPAPAPAQPGSAAPAQPAPSLEPEPEAAPLEWPSLKLSAIVLGKSTSRGAAIINGKIVEIGEEIEGVTLIGVDEEGIKLKNGPEVRTLKVGGSF